MSFPHLVRGLLVAAALVLGAVQAMALVSAPDSPRVTVTILPLIAAAAR